MSSQRANRCSTEWMALHAVDCATNPQLTVTSLKRPWTRGRVGLWGALGGANFSNVIVSPADTTGPAPSKIVPLARENLECSDARLVSRKIVLQLNQ